MENCGCVDFQSLPATLILVYCIFTRESLQSSAGIHLALLLLLLLLLLFACLLVLYALKQFDNLTLQQGSHALMQFGILPLQQGNSRRLHAVWYPATAAG
jgi:hypothetical protein